MIRPQLAAARRWTAANWTLLAAGLVACLPVILSTAHSLAVGWRPLGDDAIIALRSYDVFSSHPPLLGAHSATTGVLGEASRHLGPMLYWLLAVPARVGGPAAMVVTMGLANGAALFGAVAVARRRGGQPLMIVAAATLAVMAGSLVAHTYSDVWNPAAGLLPFTLTVFLAWTVGCGDHRLLPVMALVASFTVQCHLAFLPPTVGLIAVAIAGLIAARRRERSAGGAAPLRRTLVVTAAVLLVSWSGPLVDEAIHRPGNLEVLARTAVAGTPTFGGVGAVRAVAQSVGVPPWWLRTAGNESERLFDVARDADTLAVVSAAVILVGLLVLLVAALRRRRQDVAVAAALALVLSAGIGFVAAATPTKELLPLSLAYTLWWGTTVGAWAWLTLVCGGAVMLMGARVRIFATARGRIALAAVGVAGALASLIAAGPGTDSLRPRYEPMQRLTSRLEDEVPDDETVLVTGSSGDAFDPRFVYETGSLYALRRAGATVVTPDTSATGGAYDPSGHAVDLVLRVQRTGERVPRGARVLARIPPPPEHPREPTVVVTLRRAP